MWAVVTGARAWDGAVPGLAFAATRDSAAADVRVVWERGAHDARGPHGHTAVVADRAGAIGGAEVTLGARRGGPGAPATSSDVRAVAAHEFGHVLGLTHRTASSSVMAPDVRTDGVSAADRAVLRAWYALPAGAACR